MGIGNLSMYNCGPISRVQGSKPSSPGRVTGDQNDFLGVPVSEVFVLCLEDASGGGPGVIFGCFWMAAGSPWLFKNSDSVQYIY